MNGKWDESYRKEILSVLPIDGAKVRSKEIYEKAQMSKAYVAKYVNELIAKGVVERIQESRKNVFYKRCENVRLVAMVNDFFAELETALSHVPEPERDFKKLMEKAKIKLSDEEMRYFDPKSSLKGYISILLILKADKLLRTSIPQLKNIKYLLTESDLHVLPES